MDCVFPLTDLKKAATAVIGGQNFSGSALYLAASLFNHSCIPNVDLTFPGNDGLVFCFISKLCQAQPSKGRYSPSILQDQLELYITISHTAGEALFTAARSIKAGEHLRIAYIDITMPKADRQQQLYRGYNFLCECPACQE